MKKLLLLLALTGAGCANGQVGGMSARQRADAAADVPENHPHPPATMVSIPLDGSFNKLRCWDNGEDKVCSRDPARLGGGAIV